MIGHDCIRVSVHMYVCKYTFAHIHKHAHTQTQTQTHKYTNARTHRHTARTHTKSKATLQGGTERWVHVNMHIFTITKILANEQVSTITQKPLHASPPHKQATKSPYYTDKKTCAQKYRPKHKKTLHGGSTSSTQSSRKIRTRLKSSSDMTRPHTTTFLLFLSTLKRPTKPCR